MVETTHNIEFALSYNFVITLYTELDVLPIIVLKNEK
jgi:hypothetical protein